MSTANNWLGPIEGSHMVIAGGCGGIGLELVKQALAHKLRVTVLDLPASMKDESRVEGASYIGFDAGNDRSIQLALQTLGQQCERVDSFVFLCGYPILPRRELPKVSLNEWNDLMVVNLTSAYLLSTGLLPLLKKKRFSQHRDRGIKPWISGHAGHGSLRHIQSRLGGPDQSAGNGECALGSCQRGGARRGGYGISLWWSRACPRRNGPRLV